MREIITFLIVFIHLVISIDMNFVLDSDSNEKYLMTIDLASQQDIESQIDAFFETHTDNKVVRFNEQHLRLTAKRKLSGVELKKAIGNDEEIQEICGSTLTDVDASVLYEFVELFERYEEEAFERNNVLNKKG